MMEKVTFNNDKTLKSGHNVEQPCCVTKSVAGRGNKTCPNESVGKHITEQTDKDKEKSTKEKALLTDAYNTQLKYDVCTKKPLCSSDTSRTRSETKQKVHTNQETSSVALGMTPVVSSVSVRKPVSTRRYTGQTCSSQAKAKNNTTIGLPLSVSTSKNCKDHRILTTTPRPMPSSSNKSSTSLTKPRGETGRYGGCSANRGLCCQGSGYDQSSAYLSKGSNSSRASRQRAGHTGSALKSIDTTTSLRQAVSGPASSLKRPLKCTESMVKLYVGKRTPASRENSNANTESSKCVSTETGMHRHDSGTSLKSRSVSDVLQNPNNCEGMPSRSTSTKIAKTSAVSSLCSSMESGKYGLPGSNLDNHSGKGAVPDSPAGSIGKQNTKKCENKKGIAAERRRSKEEKRVVHIDDQRAPTINIKGVTTGGRAKNVNIAGNVHGGFRNKNKWQVYQSVINQNQIVDKLISNMEAQTHELLEMKGIPFIETTGYVAAKACLDKYGIVTLIGEAGSGKTSIGYRLLKFYKDSQTFVPLIVDDVQELKHQRDPKTPTLVFIDDIFGTSTYSVASLQMWLPIFKQMHKSLDPGKFRVIFSSRNYVFKDAQPDLIVDQNVLFRENTVIDLSEGATLLKSDKEKLLKVFTKKAGMSLRDNDLKSIVEMKTTYGFPYACYQFYKMKKWHTRPVKFFEKPIDIMIESVQSFAKVDKNKFAVLLLVLLSDGKFNLAKLRREDRILDAVHDYTNVQRISEFVTRRHQISSPLIGSYLTSTRDTLSFRHPTVEDTVAHVVGNIDPRFLMEHCSMRVVHERVRIHISTGQGSTQPTQADTQWFHIILSDDYHEDLINRFLSEITEENFTLVCLHQACSDRNFVCKLINVLEKDGKICKEKIFHQEDTKYRQSFLQWSVMNHSETLCGTILEESAFSILEKNNAIITCCVTGNSRALNKLINSLHPLGKQLLTKMRVRKLDMMVIQESEEISIKKGPVNRYNLLHVACNYGHKDVVGVLIKSGFSVESDGDYESPLHCCCRKGHVGIIDILVAHGANLEAKHSYWEETPLHMCSQFGHFGAVTKCIELGANIEANDIDRKTPLMNACRAGHERIAEYLMEQGANREAKDNSGSSPLTVACSRGHYSVVQSLVKRKSNMEPKNSSGRTALMEACQNGHTDIADFLIEKGASTEDPDGNLLHCACRGGCWNVAKSLLSNQGQLQKERNVNLLHSVTLKTDKRREESKYDIVQLLISLGDEWSWEMNAMDENNMTPLMVAVESGYEKIVKLFIKSGASLFVTSSDGQTLLHKAAKGDNANIIKLLAAEHSTNTKTSPDTTESTLDRVTFVNTNDVNAETPLHVAAMLGSFDSVEALLLLSPDIQAINSDKETPLHLAAQRQDTQMIKALIEHGADVISQDMKMKTPLHVAAMFGTVDTVQMILNKKGNVNAADHKQRTPLHKALQCRKNDIALMLIRNGSDVHVGDYRNQTPLHFAAEYGNVETLEQILAMITDVEAKDIWKQTPLHLATFRPTADNVQILLKYNVEVGALDMHGMTPLHHAAMLGRSDTVQILIDNKADINAIDINEQTSLHLAAMEERALYTAYVLLENKAELNAADTNGQTPLHVAASRCYSADTVRLLLDERAGVDVVDDKHQTPLHVAANKSDRAVIQLLLQRTANVNAQDCNGQTPLHIAVNREPDMVRDLRQKEAEVSQGFVSGKTATQFVREIVQELLNNQANVNALDSQHQTPLHIAIRKCRAELVRLLLKYGADMNVVDSRNRTPLHLAVVCERLDIVQIMIDGDVDVNASDDSGDMPLHLAAKKRDVTLCHLLLKSGAKVCAENSEGRTPLHFAASESNVNTIQTLLDEKANVNVMDRNGLTPLHMASMTRSSTQMDILLKNAADVDITNAHQQTPVHLAAGKGFTDKVQMLLGNNANVNARDDKRQTPLHIAAKGQVIVDSLNKNPGDSKVKAKLAKYGIYRHAETCQILLNFKADVLAKDKDNKTPLHLAADTGNTDIVKVLLDNGADVDAVDAGMKTPLQLSQERDRTDVMDMLVGNKMPDSTVSGPLLALPP